MVATPCSGEVRTVLGLSVRRSIRQALISTWELQCRPTFVTVEHCGCNASDGVCSRSPSFTVKMAEYLRRDTSFTRFNIKDLSGSMFCIASYPGSRG
jgi:hypothetical protein